MWISVDQDRDWILKIFRDCLDFLRLDIFWDFQDSFW